MRNAKAGAREAHMADAKVMRIDEMEAVFEGIMIRARASLGVRSFGMQVLDMPPNFDRYPVHDESSSGQEEVYVPLRGSARMLIDGAEHTLEPGVMVRVAPGTRRRVVPGGDGMRMLVIGNVPGAMYEAPEWTELGATPPHPKNE